MCVFSFHYYSCFLEKFFFFPEEELWKRGNSKRYLYMYKQLDLAYGDMYNQHCSLFFTVFPIHQFYMKLTDIFEIRILAQS